MQRRDWFDNQPDLEPERLVFIDGVEDEREADRRGRRPT